MAWWRQLVYRAAAVPVGAFHALSSLKWMVLKLCPLTLPTSSTPLKLPLQLSCPSLSARCDFGSCSGPCRLEAALWLSLGGKVGGRERCLAAGEAGCWSRQHWWGQLQLTRLVLWHFHTPENLFWFCQRLCFHVLLIRNFHSLHTAGV